METLEKIEHDILTNNLLISFVYRLCDLLNLKFSTESDAMYNKYKTLDYLTKIIDQYRNSRYDGLKYSVKKLKECLIRSLVFNISDRLTTDFYMYRLANMEQMTYIQKEYVSSIFHHLRRFNFRLVIKILGGKIKEEYKDDTTKFYDANNFEPLEYESKLINGTDVSNILEPSVLNRKPDFEYFESWTKYDKIHPLSLDGTRITDVADLIYCINKDERLKFFILSLYLHCKTNGFDLMYMFIHFSLKRGETLTRLILNLYNSMLLTDGCWRIYKSASGDSPLRYCKLKNASCDRGGNYLENFDVSEENNRNYCRDNNFKRHDLINNDNSDEIRVLGGENNYCNSIYCNVNINNYTEINDLYECFTSCIPTIYNTVLNTVPGFLEEISYVKNTIMRNRIDINYITFETVTRGSFNNIEVYYKGLYIDEDDNNCVLFYPSDVQQSPPPLPPPSDSLPSDERLENFEGSTGGEEIRRSHLNKRGINANDYVIVDDINSPDTSIVSESITGIVDNNKKFNILNYLNNNYVHSLLYAFVIASILFTILVIVYYFFHATSTVPNPYYRDVK